MHHIAVFLLVAGAFDIVTSVSDNVGNNLCPKLRCGTTSITITFEVKDLEAWMVDVNGIQPVQGSCNPTVTSNGISTTVSWPLGVNECGTKLTTNDTHATYTTSMKLPPSASQIIYREEIILNVSCTFPLNKNTSLDITLKPDLSISYITIEGFGKFKVTMALYKDSGYVLPYQEEILSLSTRQMLYVGVRIEEGDTTQFDLLMKNCFATPTNNIHDLMKYYIIEDSCPNPNDKTINVPSNGISIRGQFSIQMFKFNGDAYRYVFLHCEVYLCNKHSFDSCLPVCPKGRSRNVGPDGEILTIGPIEAKNSQDRMGKLSWQILLGILLSRYLLS